ncbi:nuclear transport factor 2 family protein [Yinghuangia seranimata]|uniref:nuclear transport factor 2 family protein n=1 Tax=Yinghuangia seranimata TaxID=408067 RepID=UPI00248D16D0|nr:nuclear transport factor 2 family protein [Yinghuangia seranimata]MDI2128117.1 nuclear transport factor 2 family protein [Yinghuangia seranimata]
MAHIEEHPNVRTAVSYHEAVARLAEPAELMEFLHPEMVHTQLPNVLFPDGLVRGLAESLEALGRARTLLADQRYEVLTAVASGDHVALEVTWSGTLAAPLGDLKAGHVLRARIAVFLEFRDGKIVAQRNYDCYERLT